MQTLHPTQMDLSRILSSPPTGAIPGFPSATRNKSPYRHNHYQPQSYSSQPHPTLNLGSNPATNYGSSSPFHYLDLSLDDRPIAHLDRNQPPSDYQLHWEPFDYSTPLQGHISDSGGVSGSNMSAAHPIDMSTSDESDTCDEGIYVPARHPRRRNKPSTSIANISIDLTTEPSHDRHRRRSLKTEDPDAGPSNSAKRRKISTSGQDSQNSQRSWRDGREIEEINLIDDEDPTAASILGKQLVDQVQSQAEPASSSTRGTKLTRFNCSICMDGITSATATTCGKSGMTRTFVLA